MFFRVSQDAQRDLDEIFIYWAERASLKVADRLMDAVTERFWILGEYPDAGKPSDEIAPGVRSFPAGRYLIYSRKTRKGIDALHIFRGVRDQRRAFRKQGSGNLRR